MPSSPGSTSRACTPPSRATSTPRPRRRSRPTRASAAALAAARRRRHRAGHGRHLVGRVCSRSPAGASAGRWPGCAATSPGDNGYARPIGGLIALVDLNSMEVVRIDDHGVLPVPGEHGDYRDGGGRPYRDDLRPIEVSQPEGSSLHAGRPGAQLGPVAPAHRLQPARVADAARARLRRRRAAPARARSRTASRSPSSRSRTPTRIRRSCSRTRSTSASTASARTPTRSRWAATAWARSATSTPSCTTARAARRRSANAICLHEEDAGILWKHFDWRSGATDVRRARRARDLDDRHGRQLRVRPLLVPHARRRGRVRGQAHGRAAHRRRRRGRAVGVGDAGRSRASARAITSTSSARASTSTSTASATCSGGRLAARSARAREPAPPVVQRARDAARERAGRPADDRPALGPALARRQPRAPQPHGRARSPTSSCPATTSA